MFFTLRNFIIVPIFLALLGCDLRQAGKDLQPSVPPGGEGMPDTILWDANQLARVKASFQSGDDDAYAADIQKVLQEAENEFQRGPFTVTDKTGPLAASGDPQDFFSVGPYWWPNPDTEDGLPYIRKDGKWNADNEADLKSIGQLIGAVRRLGLAYYLTDDERYAERASLFLQTWFLDEATRMNPHLQYAQAVPGIYDGRAVGIIDTWHMRDLIDGVQLLQPSQAWTPEKHAALQDWMAQFLQWLLESDRGKEEASASNNHGTWYLSQVGTYAAFVGNLELVRPIYETHLENLAQSQIDKDGTQPGEVSRTRAMHYSLFNLIAWLDVLHHARKLNLEMADPKSETARRVHAAARYLADYANPESDWPHKELKEPERRHMWSTLQRAARFFEDPALTEPLAGSPELSPPPGHLRMVISQITSEEPGKEK